MEKLKSENNRFFAVKRVKLNGGGAKESLNQGAFAF